MKLSRTGLAVGGLGALVLLTVAAMTSPWADTRYAPGYDDEAFARIAIGDPEDRVRALLGEPLAVPEGRDHNGAMCRYLHYSKTTRSPTHMVRRCVIVDDATRRVVRIDDAVVWSYGSRLFSS